MTVEKSVKKKQKKDISEGHEVEKKVKKKRKKQNKEQINKHEVVAKEKKSHDQPNKEKTVAPNPSNTEKPTDDNKPLKRKKKRKKKLPPLPAPDAGAFEAMLVDDKTNANQTNVMSADENAPDKDEAPKKRKRKVVNDDVNMKEDETPKKELKKAKKSKKVKEVKIEESTEKENEPVAAKELALEYLKQWHNHRDSWSFKKVRQVWLLHNMFNKDVIPDKTFKILLAYLQNAKGAAKTKTVSDAEEYFASCEDNEDMTDEQIIKLERSRELIQHLS